MKVINQRVIVEPCDEEAVTSGGIIIPETDRERARKGIVVGLCSSITEIKLGDEIMYGKHTGTDIEIDEDNLKGKDLLIMRIDDVLLEL